MTSVGKLATISEFRLSKHLAANDDAAANEEEVEEQIEDENVEKVADQNRTVIPFPHMINQQINTAHDAVASGEQIEEQAEESPINKVAFEDGITTTAAEEYIKRGRAHD
jgi:hypothetical protein